MWRKFFYITTPIYYVNDKPHIGHAYTTLACDVLARFKRLDGLDVKFLTGTDEHGQKIEKSAYAAGLTPEIFTNNVSQKFLSLTRTMECSNDDFIRTSEARHFQACQALWKALEQRGQIYLSCYTGWYSVQDETFWNRDELIDMPNGNKVTPTGGMVEWIEEPSYFFRLSQWKNSLLQLYDTRPDFVMPESRRNEVIRFVQMGLEDLSISRTTFTWGIPVPGDSTHIIYVWLDALTNYLTAIGYPEYSDTLTHYWANSLHIVGKDILRFHAIYWPAFLMAAGLEPPQRIFAHGWWTNKGQKISKSLGNSIDPISLVARYGVDQVRYFLLREVPFGSDGDFSHTAIISRINSDLTNELGNLGLRVLSLINRYCFSCVPNPRVLTMDDRQLLSQSSKLLEQIHPVMERLAFHEVLEMIWSVIRSSNSYISYQAPWRLYKDNPTRMETVLYVLAETLRYIALLMLPFVPQSANSLLDQLAVTKDSRIFSAVWKCLEPNTPLPEPKGIFPRFRE